MSKIRPLKKKVNFKKSTPVLEKTNPINRVYEVVINRHAEVIFTFDEVEARNVRENFPMSDIYDKDRYLEITPGLPKKLVNGYMRFIRGTDLPKTIAWGLKIREFMATRNEELGLEIIKQNPKIIFDDGVEISLAIFLSKFSKGAKKIIDIKKAGFEWIDLQVETGCGFDNPLRELVIWWSTQTRNGTPNEQKRARYYLDAVKKALFKSLIHTPVGRKQASISSNGIAEIKPFISTFYHRIKRHKNRKENLIKTYNSTLRDIQELFKNCKYHRDYYRALIKYIEENNLREVLQVYVKPNYEGQLTVDEIANILLSKRIDCKHSAVSPSSIALHIANAKFGVKTAILKNLKKVKSARR